MGGYVFQPRQGFPPWGNDMDYNIQVDVESAHCVIESSSPTLITLAVTVETSLRRAYLETLKQSGPLGQLLARQAEVFARDEQMETKYGQTCDGLADDTINFLHDPLACAIASGWNEGVEITQLNLRSEIKDGWLSQAVVGGGKPTSVVTRVDGALFSEFWLKTVTG
jgi:inosine-uridine nucleoside N-ribohydrolase